MAYSNLYHNLTKSNHYKKGGMKKNVNDIMKLFNEKKGFLTKVFLNLIFQLSIIAYVSSKAENMDILNTGLEFFGTFVVSLMLIVLMAIINNPFIKFILFVFFSVITGLVLSKRLAYATPEMIKTAIFGTLGIFIGMFLFTIVLLMFGIKVGSRFGLFLLIALIIMIIVLVVSYFMKASPITYKIISGILLFLFALFIIYDTTNILVRDFYGNDFISASLDYLLDIINIFINLLNINN